MIADKNKTKEQLENEISKLRLYIAGLEARETDRRLTVEALEEKKAKQYLDLAGVIFIALNENRRVTLANRKACEVFECTEKQIVNKKWPDILFSLHDKPNKAAHPKISYKKLMAGDIGSVGYFEGRFLAKSGKIKIIAWHNAFIRNKNNRITEIICSGEDITDRKRAEESLRESEDRYRSLVQTANDAIMTFDSRGNVKSWNRRAEEIFGYPVNEVLNKSFLLIVPQRFHKAQMQIFRQAISAGHLFFEGRVLQGVGARKDNSEFPSEFSVSLLKSGAEYIFMAIMRDVTERKQAEEALLKSKKEMEVQTHNLEEVNTALRVLLNKRDEDKTEIEEKVLFNVEKLVLPYVKKLNTSELNHEQKRCLNNIESNLKDIISPFPHRLGSSFLNLTPSEIKVANLVKDGKRSKEIAELMNLSSKTIEFHRNNIRKKFGIKNKSANLRSYLLSIK